MIPKSCRMPVALLLLPFILGSAYAADQGSRVLFKIAPIASDSLVLPPSIPLTPSRPSFPSRLESPTPAPSLFSFPALDTLGKDPKAFDFQEYWAQVEKENGIDDLRRRVGMLSTDSRVPSAVPEGQGLSSLNLLGSGVLLYRAWKAHDEKAARERRFQMRVGGLIDLASRFEDRQGAAPGISIIVAKLDFMGKRVAGSLPNRQERRMFTENLKAWAVNPVFDTTALGPALMEVCRLYEEYER
jgi:hypothetical protein